MVRSIILLIVSLCLCGCGTFAYLVTPPPRVDDLAVTEDDVKAVIAALDGVEPSDPDAVVYNPASDRYELTPGAMENALADSVMKEAYEMKLKEIEEKMEHWSLGAVFRRDMMNILTGAIGLLIIILAL